MGFPVGRRVLIAVTAGALLAAAGPAHATFTPVNATATGLSTNSNITFENDGNRIRCPRVEFSGRTTFDGRALSGTLAFSADPVTRVRCVATLYGSPEITCRGNVTWRSTSSVATRSAGGTVSFDSGFECRIVLFGSPTSLDKIFRGPQSPTNTGFSFSQSSQTLTASWRTVALDGGGELGFEATFAFSPRLTVS